MADALALVPRFANDPSRQIVQATLRIASDIKEHLVARGPAGRTTRGSSRRCTGRRRAPSASRRSRETTTKRSSCAGAARLRRARRPGARPAGGGPAPLAQVARRPLRRFGGHGRRRARGRRTLRRSRPVRPLPRGGEVREPAAPRPSAPLQRARQLPGSGAAEGSLRAVRWTRRSTTARRTSTFFASIGTSVGRAALWEFVQPNFDAIVARMPRETTGQIAVRRVGILRRRKGEGARLLPERPRREAARRPAQPRADARRASSSASPRAPRRSRGWGSF